MPVDKKLMGSLKKQYGAKSGKSVYYAMMNAGKGPFGPGHKLSGERTAHRRKVAKKRRVARRRK